MAIYKCSVCDTEFDEIKESKKWDQLPDDWACDVCESGKPFCRQADATARDDPSRSGIAGLASAEGVPAKTFDEFETTMADIHNMAETGQSIIEPMRTRHPTFSWDDVHKLSIRDICTTNSEISEHT